MKDLEENRCGGEIKAVGTRRGGKDIQTYICTYRHTDICKVKLFLCSIKMGVRDQLHPLATT
jgi:hypothetical protein